MGSGLGSGSGLGVGVGAGLGLGLGFVTGVPQRLHHPLTNYLLLTTYYLLLTMYSLLLTTHRRAAGRLHHFLARYHACQPEVGYPDGGALARVGVEDVLRLEIAVHYLVSR